MPREAAPIVKSILEKGLVPGSEIDDPPERAGSLEGLQTDVYGVRFSRYSSDVGSEEFYAKRLYDNPNSCLSVVLEQKDDALRESLNARITAQKIGMWVVSGYSSPQRMQAQQEALGEEGLRELNDRVLHSALVVHVADETSRFNNWFSAASLRNVRNVVTLDQLQPDEITHILLPQAVWEEAPSRESGEEQLVESGKIVLIPDLIKRKVFYHIGWRSAVGFDVELDVPDYEGFLQTLLDEDKQFIAHGVRL